jgi:hypothetical protein
VLLASQDGLCSTKYVDLHECPKKPVTELLRQTDIRIFGIRNFKGHSEQGHEEIIQVHYASNES